MTLAPSIVVMSPLIRTRSRPTKKRVKKSRTSPWCTLTSREAHEGSLSIGTTPESLLMSPRCMYRPKVSSSRSTTACLFEACLITSYVWRVAHARAHATSEFGRIFSISRSESDLRISYGPFRIGIRCMTLP
jgi:hypothetical protein